MLREEFPDISISKLRFLQDKGIVTPERSSGGYRLYTGDDVEALRAALQMQRDEFMPLRVIRDELRRRLDSGDGPARPPRAATRPVGTMPAAGDVRLDADAPLVSAEALVRAAHVSHEFLDACRASDIVSGTRDGDGPLRYSPDEVGLVSVAGVLANLGLDVRHLRQAAMAMHRQGSVVEQYAAAILRAPGDDARQRALETVEAVTTQLAEFMRIAFVRDVKLTASRITNPSVRDPRARSAAANLL